MRGEYLHTAESPWDAARSQLQKHICSEVPHLTVMHSSLEELKANTWLGSCGKIEINTPSFSNKKSELGSMTKQNDFTLSLYSSKQIYKSNEVIDIWSTFQYSGENEAVLGHGKPILAFYIEDSSGHQTSDITETFLVKEKMKPNTIITAPYPLNLNMEMNSLISGIQDLDEFNKAYPKPWLLPKGKYTVGVLFRHPINREAVELSTELNIVIE